MVVREQTVLIIECDGCDKMEFLTGDMPVGWIEGTVLEHSTSGGQGGEWSACKPAHIKAAVLEAIRRNDG